ncbi:RidA family protein [Xenophilus arseniciresistens]|uniref:RidA family protein n=1 Tax=Xenophilus arseniciresistens TaxID=1283306 RepID=A0AAE3N9H5_9BURK|nr:RidA family protein [Xenophilus arseniciresistens]MDA7417088.1 RidA family protein [Xenophilus arseniciresistens]
MNNDDVIQRLKAAGLALPRPTLPAANYVPFTRLGSLLFVAGQTPVQDGEPQYLGVVGTDVDIESAQAAARLCALNVLAQVGVACEGRFERVRALRIGGFVRCTADFTQQAMVMNGASDLFVLALGERGKHARTAVGTHALPRGVPVEVDGMFAIE